MKKKKGIKSPKKRDSPITEMIKEICLVPNLNPKNLPNYYDKVLHI